MMARAGVTSAHDALGGPDDLRAYQDAHEAGTLAIRVYCLVRYAELDRMIAAGVRTGMGDEWVRIGAVKLMCDGSISERTARLSEPYVGRPDDHGILVMDEPELYEAARKAHLAGWQIGTHANGDVAIDKTLRVYERLQRESPRKDPRFRIEHCTVINQTIWFAAFALSGRFRLRSRRTFTTTARRCASMAPSGSTACLPSAASWMPGFVLRKTPTIRPAPSSL